MQSPFFPNPRRLVRSRIPRTFQDSTGAFKLSTMTPFRIITVVMLLCCGVHADETQRAEQQRGKVPAAGVEPDVDGHEIQAPQQGYKDGKEGFAQAHAPTLAEVSMKHQRVIQH